MGTGTSGMGKRAATGINFNLSWHRTRAQRKDKAMSRMLDGIVAGIEKGAKYERDGNRDAGSG